MAERPSPTDIRRMRKADLLAWCTEFGLDMEGKVDELRERLLQHLEATAKAEPEAAPAEPEAARVEEKPEAVEKEAPEERAAETAREKGKEEEKDGEEKEAYTPKLKPHLEPSIRDLLRVRREIAKRRPTFSRQEWFRIQRLGWKWRKPQGMQSKLRRHLGYRPNVASIGYRGPKAVRGLHPSGFREVLVHTVRELDGINPKTEAARIAGSVGMRRRTEIQAAADEKGIRVLNRREAE